MKKKEEDFNRLLDVLQIKAESMLTETEGTAPLDQKLRSNIIFATY